VKQDNRKLDEMLKLSKGARRVPVVVIDDKVSIGYDGGS